MATDESAPGVSGEQPVIVDRECGDVRFVAHRELEAVEMVLVDPSGRGFRTWIGHELAPTAALQFVGATMRLLERVTT